MGKGERKGFNSYGHLKFLVNFVISSNLLRYDFHQLVIKTAKNGLVFHPFLLFLLFFPFLLLHRRGGLLVFTSLLFSLSTFLIDSLFTTRTVSRQRVAITFVNARYYYFFFYLNLNSTRLLCVRVYVCYPTTCHVIYIQPMYIQRC